MIRTAIFAVLALVCVTLPSEARQRHRVASCVETGGVMAPVCGTAQAGSVDRKEAARVARGRYIAAELGYGGVRPRAEPVSQVLGGRPMGCPSRFCGCGASLHLFGRIIPSLNLAANWLRFPRAAPAPKMAAARSGHVFVLEQHISGDTWLVFDANSGGHRTRLHVRSIAGYAIVNPHGAG